MDRLRVGNPLPPGLQVPDQLLVCGGASVEETFPPRKVAFVLVL